MREQLPLLRALADARVSYVVVGGTAVALQGHPRKTRDLDMVLDPRAENVRRALAVLTAAGLHPRAAPSADVFADPETRAGWAAEHDATVFGLGDPRDRRRDVNLLAVEPVPFEELRRESRLVRVDGTPVRVASRRHLIQMKTGSGRQLDEADVAALWELEHPAPRGEEPEWADGD